MADQIFPISSHACMHTQRDTNVANSNLLVPLKGMVLTQFIVVFNCFIYYKSFTQHKSWLTLESNGNILDENIMFIAYASLGNG